MLYVVNSKRVDIAIGTVVDSVSETENTITLMIDGSNAKEPNTQYGLRTYPREYFVLPDWEANIGDTVEDIVKKINWVKDVRMEVTEVVEKK